MTKVAILPVPTEQGGLTYRGVAGDKWSQGSTVGEALDAITNQLSDAESGLLIVVQGLRPDRFFNAFQQTRLAELMRLWRTAQDKGEVFPSREQAELDNLVDLELRASADRAAALADEARQ